MIPAAARRFAALALGITLSAATAAAQPAPEPGALPLVYALQSRGEVALRSGERVRPRITVECAGAEPRIRLDLNASRSGWSAKASALTGRVVVRALQGETLVERASATIVWSPGERPWTWAIPESSSWSDSLAGASVVRIEPDSTGPILEPIEFAFGAVAPWTAARGRCSSPPRPATPMDRPRALAPTQDEYVYVDEFPEAIEKPKCTPVVDAQGKRVAGSVVVQALVSAEGRVAEWKIVKSAPGLDQAAIECVRGYRFKPAKGGGKPIAVWVAIPIRYNP